MGDRERLLSLLYSFLHGSLALSKQCVTTANAMSLLCLHCTAANGSCVTITLSIFRYVTKRDVYSKGKDNETVSILY